MRRVLFVHNGPLFRSNDGRLYGVHYTDPIIERYRQLGEHVTFLMRGRDVSSAHGRPMEIKAKNFEFIEVDDIVSPLAKLRHLSKARRIIRKAVKECSLVVARIPSAVSSETVKIAREMKKPYLVECVACNRDALWHYNWKGKLASAWYSRKQKNLIWQSPFVLYVTSEFLQSRYPSQGESVGISDVAIGEVGESELQSRLASIEDWIKSHRPLRLVTIADLNVPYKAQADVVRALSKLKAEGITCEYHLIGGGDPSRLKAVISQSEIESQITIHGTIPHADIFSHLRSMDIYVHPSRTEGLPRAIVESFCVALPTIGSRVGGIPELLPADRLFQPGSVHEITKLIKSMNSPEILRQDALRNWNTAHEFQTSVLDGKRTSFFNRFLTCNGLA